MNRLHITLLLLACLVLSEYGSNAARFGFGRSLGRLRSGWGRSRGLSGRIPTYTGTRHVGWAVPGISHRISSQYRPRTPYVRKTHLPSAPPAEKPVDRPQHKTRCVLG